MDMTKFTEAKSDQWNAADFSGGPRQFTIEGVSINPTQEQPVSVKLIGEDRVWRLCKTTARILVAAWGADASKYSGRSVELFCDPSVTWSGMAVGGIRISAMSHMESDLKIAVSLSRQKKSVVLVKRLTITAPTPSATQSPDNALELCEAAAARGTDAFRAWWGSDEGKACRAVAQDNIERLKGIAAAADPAPESTDEEPPM